MVVASPLVVRRLLEPRPRHRKTPDQFLDLNHCKAFWDWQFGDIRAFVTHINPRVSLEPREIIPCLRAKPSSIPLAYSKLTFTIFPLLLNSVYIIHCRQTH